MLQDMAGTSSSNGSINEDVLENFRSATTSILTDDGFTVPKEGTKLCLQLANKFKDIFKEPTEEESFLLKS